MSSDETENLIKFLSFLKTNYPESYFPEHISKKIELPSDIVSGISENALLNQWVDLETRTRAGPIIRINSFGNKKLNQLTGRNDPSPIQPKVIHNTIIGDKNVVGDNNVVDSFNPKIKPSSNKFDKWNLVVAVVVAVFVITASSIVITTYFYPQESDIQKEECVSQAVGLTFRDCDLGFEITRPNIEWIEPTEVNQFNLDSGDPVIEDSRYLGGFVFGKKGEGSFVINVFDSTKFSSENPLKEMANEIYQGLKTENPEVMVKEPFFVGDNAIIEMEGLFNSKPLIIKITIVQHNEKFYVFDKSFRPDMADTFLKDFRSEQDQLIDSFNYLD